MTTTPPEVRAMQVVTLRMLHDAAFREAVYRHPSEALAGAGLPEGAAEWFAAPDPRAWDVDPLRNARLLAAVLEEYPATGLALALAGWRLPRLHAFFASEAFHAGIAAWRTQADAFGAWIEETGPGPTARAFARLERAVAASRRALPDAGGGALRAAAGVVAFAAPEGTLARYAEALRWLGRPPGGGAERVAKALQQGPPRATPPLRLAAGGETEGLAVARRGGAEPAVSEVGEGVVGLVGWLGPGRARGEALAWLEGEGLGREDGAALLDELVADGVLTGG